MNPGISFGSLINVANFVRNFLGAWNCAVEHSWISLLWPLLWRLIELHSKRRRFRRRIWKAKRSLWKLNKLKGKWHFGRHFEYKKYFSLLKLILWLEIPSLIFFKLIQIRSWRLVFLSYLLFIWKIINRRCPTYNVWTYSLFILCTDSFLRRPLFVLLSKS